MNTKTRLDALFDSEDFACVCVKYIQNLSFLEIEAHISFLERHFEDVSKMPDAFLSLLGALNRVALDRIVQGLENQKI